MYTDGLEIPVGTGRRVARFSTEGDWIALTGQYDLDEQVDVLPCGGGVPRQLTFRPVPLLSDRAILDNLVYGWIRDGSALPFRCLCDTWNSNSGRLFTADWTANRVPPEEWRQVFHEVCRRYRDFFFTKDTRATTGRDCKGLKF